ncbi:MULTISPECIES: calcium-translocating P-type ATPase, PMCA-type [Duncaniella]|jgi:Ca2+-transporting ATPase|uniref:P-type Ca(2+) transporter n=2 Tax=Duncaniella TaxID=2518495 RepID=A0A4P7W181_9BACT|nr:MULTISPECIES: calcium-translocating P-type ATPase, PMCA-type [Duncaniella]MCX4283461.1 calcium-translocating P-type ATPase, PMCA-type [Duncaniella dubosii]QCD41185.1 calcium-translocating P-type ATPase, PMCA-type [Duncaniella dubosii]ROS86110.1 calcium-translocating P-type ATPase, PMCA-type [Muribaculaceae bacterium Isolate-080 (Janvier)]HBN62905.1 calcium-translocating P-type ATPase, PMCA-type [Porphyromonadaceae bacterium]
MNLNADQRRGLTRQQVEESRRLHGANVLTPPKEESLWRLFLDKFKDPLIIVLLMAGVLSVLISCYEYFALHQAGTVFFEPVGIFMAIFLATGLSFYFEKKAEDEFKILNQVNDDELVQVIRDGNPTEISKKDVVVGDILILNTGQEIPADARLLESTQLNVDESTLTGEPMASKTTDPDHFDPEATFPSDHVMRGTRVMEGHGVAEVYAVGDSTENGKVYEAAHIDDGTKTPLTEQLERLGALVTKGSYVIGGAVILGRIVMYMLSTSGFEWLPFIAYFLQSIMIAVTLVVVSVPEGLPMAVTLSLAYSMRRMLRTNNLVRKMHACETMGATTVICTDKTGTLTQNQMRVAETDFYALPGQKLGDDAMSRLIETAVAVNSTAQLDLSDEEHPSVLGNPTEGALLLWLRQNGVDYRPLREEAKVVRELPFTTERKYMATVIAEPGGGERLFVKGAPEIVLAMSDSVNGGVERAKINEQLLGYQEKAMRTLAFATCLLPEGADGIGDNGVDADGLEFIGVVAIADPVRAEVPDSIRECINAGIAIKIVTGDTPATAREIGRQIGLWQEGDGDRNIITGPEFGALTDSELADRVGDLKIIARARPMDKKRLVETLQKQGQVVAVTGDGTNDAPALKAANVGLSMGDGTSVAKEASDITIVDNSFASIGRAVMWGRSLFQNLQRFILFQLTVNVVACLVVLVGAFMGTESPLTVTQMLWVNLIMDTFASMALSSLPPSRSVMNDRPRDRRSFIITSSMWRFIGGVGVMFAAVVLGMVYLFEHAEVNSLADILHVSIGAPQGLSPYELSIIFTTFVMLQFWNLFNARAYATHKSAFHLKACGEFLLIALVIFVGQVVIVTIGGEFFNVVPLKIEDWAIIVIGTSLVLWVGELLRIVSRIGR